MNKKSCNSCIKLDVCSHFDNIINSFKPIIEIRFGPLEIKEIEDLKNFIGECCRYFVVTQGE